MTDSSDTTTPLAAPSLPNLLLVGAMRAGTTTGYRVLASHPQIYMSPWKEPHFLALAGKRPTFAGPGDNEMNRNAVVDLSAYRALFADADDATWRGEASATYLYLDAATEGIQRYLDSPRALVFLRDPIDRAFSSFEYLQGQGREPLDDFEDALGVEIDRIAAGWSPMWHYRQASHYKPQLERLYAVLPSANVRVCLFDDLRERPEVVFREIWHWLGVDTTADIPVSVHNRSGQARSTVLAKLLRPSPLKRRLSEKVPGSLRSRLRTLRESNLQPPSRSLPSATRHALLPEFDADIAYVEELLGKPLPAWRTT